MERGREGQNAKGGQTNTIFENDVETHFPKPTQASLIASAVFTLRLLRIALSLLINPTGNMRMVMAKKA